MLEVYPEMIAQLKIEAFNHILGTLDFGLRHLVNITFFYNGDKQLYEEY